MYSMYVPVTSTYNAVFTYGGNYTNYKKNRLLYQQYASSNPTKVVCNATPTAIYPSYALKQGVQKGCMYRQMYCIGCTKNGIERTGLQKNSNVWIYG